MTVDDIPPYIVTDVVMTVKGEKEHAARRRLCVELALLVSTALDSAVNVRLWLDA